MYIYTYINTHSLSLSSSKQTILKMEHVTFTYPGKETPQLTDVSLRVRAIKPLGGLVGWIDACMHFCDMDGWLTSYIYICVCFIPNSNNKHTPLPTPQKNS